MSTAPPKSLAADQLTTSYNAEQVGELRKLPECDRLSAPDPRAEEALQFGLDINAPGYNLYLAGEPGTSRVRRAMDHVEPVARHRELPRDWLYVNNFDSPREPRAISLPPHQGLHLQKDIDRFIESLLATFPAVFENPAYLQQKNSLQKQFDKQYESAVAQVERAAAQKNIATFRDDAVFTFTPIFNGEPADDARFAQMTEDERERYQTDVAALEMLLNNVLFELPDWQRTLNKSLRDLKQATIRQSLKPLIEDLQQRHQGNAGVLMYIAQINNHLPKLIEEQFAPTGDQEMPPISQQRKLLAQLYRPNVISSSAGTGGAPVVTETNPTYYNLFGRIDYPHEPYQPYATFQMISGGSLHTANHGYLVIDIEKLLAEPFTWEALKRCMRDREIRIEPPISDYSSTPPALLKPEPIPFNAKVILVGPREIYYTLDQHDRDFEELFRVLVDFDAYSDSTLPHQLCWMERLETRLKEQGLSPLSDCALARLMTYSARLAEHQQRLSARIDPIIEIAVEADYLCRQARDSEIRELHINRAIEARRRRNSRLQDRLLTETLNGTIAIASAGEAIGRVNGLTVLHVGDFAFGCPSRISATASPGSRGLVDIEREVELGQAIHSKGVLILSGFLSGRYAQDFPLALSAHIAIEQSYDFIDGDSASLAEACALISALTNTPLTQELALTGAINQHGEVQAVGGINEKIEGFFALCEARGFTGRQGVIIPSINRNHLMLEKHVVDAARRGQFHIYAVAHIDEALSLLTGVDAGTPDSKGHFVHGCLNHRVVQRLHQFSKLTQVKGNGG
jgi:predicted ATP-dependent protease